MQVPERDFMSWQLIQYFESIQLDYHIYDERYTNIFGTKTYSLEYIINYARQQCYQAIELGRHDFKFVRLVLTSHALEMFWQEVAPFFLKACEIEFYPDKEHMHTIRFREARANKSNNRDAANVLLLLPVCKHLHIK